MITKNISTKYMGASPNGVIMIKQVTQIIENGKVISESNHRGCIEPGKEFNQELFPEIVSPNDLQIIQEHIELEWTPEVIKKYKESIKQEK